MTKFAMLAGTAMLAVCAQTFAAVADEVPNFDVKKSCKFDIQASPGSASAAGCLVDEQKAKEALAKLWTQFEPDSKKRCVDMVSDISGTQSYVELLTCLQIAKDAKPLPKE